MPERAFCGEFFGSTDYGATGGAIDPLDPNVMVGMGCEWKLDPKTGLVVLRGDHLPRRDGEFTVRGRQQWPALSCGLPAVGNHERTFRPVFLSARAKVNTSCAGSFISRAIGQGAISTTRYWADANGDGLEQPGRNDHGAGQSPFYRLVYGVGPDMTFYSFDNTLGERLVRVTGLHKAAGAPLDMIWHIPVEIPHADEKAHVRRNDRRSSARPTGVSSSTMAPTSLDRSAFRCL